MPSIRERPHPALQLLPVDALDVLQSWRERDIDDLDVDIDEADDVKLLARLRDDVDASDWVSV
jgi:hypothetical protein